MKSQQQELFQGYELPKTNLAEILLTLILQGNVSIFDFPYLSGYRTRLSELQLKHFLPLDRQLKEKQNKFKNTYQYAIHYLSENNKEKAIELYNKINK